MPSTSSLRRAVALATAALLLAFLPGCDKGPKKTRIGFAMTLNDPYWQNMRLGALDEAEKLGAAVTILNAEEDVQKQSQQINDLIAQGVDIVCLVPMKPDALVNSVRALNDRKIPVIIVNRGARPSLRAKDFVLEPISRIPFRTTLLTSPISRRIQGAAQQRSCTPSTAR